MPDDPAKAKLSHIDERGEARMVDVAGKAVTVREAAASAVVTVREAVLDAIFDNTLQKGDALAAARIAAIMAAKRTSDWVPLCHPLALDWVGVEISRTGTATMKIFCSARTSGRTGVEMEALTGVSAAALTIYDMAKAADRSIVIGPIQLERKSGGHSGTFDRSTDEGGG
jgi:cyclic pyranopterin phosphate synthase